MSTRDERMVRKRHRTRIYRLIRANFEGDMIHNIRVRKDRDQLTLTGAIVSLVKEARANRRIRWVNAYAVSRNWGGPEEGGWWYDSGVLIASVPCYDRDIPATKERLKKMFGWDSPHPGRYSVIGEADFEIYVEDERGSDWPEKVPHYE